MNSPRVISLPPDQSLLPDGTKAGGWWHDADEPGRMICDLCPRACNLKSGDRGFCFVRQNRDGQMVLTTYGRSTGFCIDPIEKKPLNHFYPGTSVLSFGTAGCNLGCKFCQNHDISKARKVELLSEQAQPETIARAAVELGCHSVAYTYNDPVIWAEYAIDTARACREVGVKSVAVTAGYITPQARGPFFEYFDAANVDLKAFTDEFYQQLTLAHLKPVLETLEWLKKETDVWFEITNLIIPDANDSDDELRRMCDWVLAHVGDEVPVHFTAFHPDYRMLDRPRTPHETLLAAHDVGKRAGLQYVYVGNVNDLKHQSTYCPRCKNVVIERDWYQLGDYHLRGSECRHCGHPIPGRFGSSPGQWGRKRMPVQISRFASPSTQDQEAADSAARPIQTTPANDEGTSVATSHLRATQVGQPPPSPEGEPTVSHVPPTAQTPEGDCPIDLSPTQQKQIHAAACEIMAAVATGRPAKLDDPTLAEAAQQPVMGAYVSAKRRGMLRGCCGSIGTATPLLAAVESAAKRTAADDFRLPPISPGELESLDVEVWLLQGLIPVEAQGEARAREIVIGRDGLLIARGNARGLLLPGVATENKLDAEGFLQQVCIKAGLPPTTWKEPDTTLHRFEGRSLGGPFDKAVLERTTTELAPPVTSDEFDQLAKFCRENVALNLRGAVPNYYLPSVSDGMIHGVALTVRIPGQEPAYVAQLSLRPPIPMQTTLYSLAETVARLLQSRAIDVRDLESIGIDLAILDDPSMHGTAEEPDLRGFDPSRRAILAIAAGKSAWRFDPSQAAEQVVERAVESLRLRSGERASLYSLRALASQPPFEVTNVPRPKAGARVRPPAVAGSFYPADAAELDNAVSSMIPNGQVTRGAWRAALVPHAGLRFSGRIAAQVLAQVEIPDTVIVIGPKHTRLGVDWAVAPHEVWSLPGIEMASDTKLADELAAAIDDLEMDALAHQKEHAIEVELPFLHRLAPQAKVVGIAVGSGNLRRCREFAKGLEKVLRQRKDRVLLVISSDMNHYASDAENRRLDEMALRALESLNTEDVYKTVRKHNISMCGVLPAVMILEALHRIQPLTTAKRVAYATSADVTGDASRVVGYAGMLFE